MPEAWRSYAALVDEEVFEERGSERPTFGVVGRLEGRGGGLSDLNRGGEFVEGWDHGPKPTPLHCEALK